MELKRLREILLDPRKPYDRLDEKNTSDKLKAVGEDYALLWTKVPQFQYVQIDSENEVELVKKVI